VTFGEFLGGSLELIAIAVALGFAAVRLRGRLLPGWFGAPARLAEVVLGISLFVVISELVGVVGLYYPGWVLGACVVAGVGIGLFAGTEHGKASPLPAPGIATWALLVGVGAALLVALHWAMGTQVGLDIGMYLPNTTWHNAPFATRFVQEHQVGAVHFTEVLKLTVWFYPQNSELLHSSGQLFLKTDFLSPLMNIGWMALCLLAAWSFGRPFGAAVTALLGVALVLDAEMLLLYQPGDAKNDIPGLFFLLAAIALIVNAEAQARGGAASARPIAGGAAGEPPPEPPAPPGRGFLSGRPGLKPEITDAAIAIAGLAAGLALGTKLNLLAPFGLLTLGVIWVMGPGRRLRTAVIWAGSALITGGFWFARNLVETGNPLPWFDAGPLPGPSQEDIDIREPHTVSDYLFNADVIRDDLIPGLHHSFGPLWPLTLAVLMSGIVLAIWRGRTPVIRMLGVVAGLSAIAYLFTPLTAAGNLNDPTAFEVNIRYAAPALALGGLLLAVDVALDRGRAQQALMAGLGLLLLISASPIDAFEDPWRKSFLAAGILLAVMLIAVPVALAVAGRRGAPRVAVAAGIALALGIAIGVGWQRNDDYLDDRYQAATAPDDFPQGVRSALEAFNEEDPRDVEVAVVGGRPGFKQYVFYGSDLSNHVQYAAHEGPHGSFTPITECEEWIANLNGGDYDYVVIGPDQRTQTTPPVEVGWTAPDPAATFLVEDDLVSVYRLEGELSPSTCNAQIDPGGPPPKPQGAEPAA
jgi:hypothetical protein